MLFSLFLSPLDRQCYLWLCRSEEHRKRERRKDSWLHPSLFAAIVADREREAGSWLYAAEPSTTTPTTKMMRTTRAGARSKVVKVFTHLFHRSPLCKQPANTVYSACQRLASVARFSASVALESNYNQMTDLATLIQGTMTRKARHNAPATRRGIWISDLDFFLLHSGCFSFSDTSWHKHYSIFFFAFSE